jgi:hypothetical protein
MKDNKNKIQQAKIRRNKGDQLDPRKGYSEHTDRKENWEENEKQNITVNKEEDLGETQTNLGREY